MNACTMKEWKASRRFALVAALASASFATVAHADPVTDFRTYRSGTGNGTAPALSGQGTNDPIVGDLSGNPASAGVVLGYLDTPVTLGANVGDKITFSFNVHFNDAVGLTPSGDNFRWALFDLNGEAKESATGGLNGGPTYDTAGTENTDQFRGFWLGNFGGGGAGNAGSVRQRSADLDSSSNNPFTNNAANPAMDIGSVTGDTVPLVSDVNGDGAGFDYSGTLTLTRAAGDLIDVSGTFTGTNIGEGEVDNIHMSDASVAGSSTYGAVGFLIGGPLSVDQAIFTDIEVTAMPAGGIEDADFDGDSDVDGADFLIWQRGLGTGSTNMEGNADGDADVDADDLAVWKAQFGDTLQVPSVAAVPEPSGLLLLVGASLGGFAWSRYRAAARV